ncbi:MAG: hypothetical protein LBL44_02515 [Treponema sp.]|jgi:S-formylglutathione hydrolase FrmB|nr:hypothetical protein [Treponema sp.]
MILLEMNLYSQSLGKKTEAVILLPAHSSHDKPVKTLWFLHGMGDDHTGCLRNSLLEAEAEKYGVAVVFPNADLSFYNDMAYGCDYAAWISKELPDILSRLLPLSKNPKDNYIAGISMGAYGAFLTALTNSEKYHTAVSLSGPMRIDWIYQILTDRDIAGTAGLEDDGKKREACRLYSEKNRIPELLVTELCKMSGERTIRAFEAMFGIRPALRSSPRDLFFLAEKILEKKQELALMAFCGEQDYHYESNLLFRDFAARSGLKYSLTTGSGAHVWDYWNRYIPVMMEKLFGSP